MTEKEYIHDPHIRLATTRPRPGLTLKRRALVMIYLMFRRTGCRHVAAFIYQHRAPRALVPFCKCGPE